jgi:hypothetical protein
MNLMQLMQSVMNSVVKCLVSSIFLLFTIRAPAQEVEYIDYDDYYWGVGKTMREAIEDLKTNVNDVITVATKSTLRNDNGKQDYKSVVGTETFFTIPESGITLIPMEGYWRAGIEKSKVKHVEGQWVEQNITVNNTYNSTPTYSRGFRRTQTTRVTTRRTDVRGPSGRVVNSIPGGTTRTITDKAWNGRYGWSYERTK